MAVILAQNLIIASDACLLGWGTTCDGQPAQGQWSTLKVSHHINYLELLAAFYALQTFAANAQNLHVQLKLDNSTAISYLSNMGGSKSDSLNSLARQLWEWCVTFCRWSGVLLMSLLIAVPPEVQINTHKIVKGVLYWTTTQQPLPITTTKSRYYKERQVDRKKRKAIRR